MKLKRVILSGCLVLLAGCGHEHQEKLYSEKYYASQPSTARNAEIASCKKSAPNNSIGKQNCANANYAQRIHNALAGDISAGAASTAQSNSSNYTGVHGFHNP
ncbi:EexN family lipoprotein [Acidithiobacillus sp.]